MLGSVITLFLNSRHQTEFNGDRLFYI